jgi:hypothetical protein
MNVLEHIVTKDERINEQTPRISNCGAYDRYNGVEEEFSRKCAKRLKLPKNPSMGKFKPIEQRVNLLTFGKAQPAMLRNCCRLESYLTAERRNSILEDRKRRNMPKTGFFSIKLQPSTNLMDNIAFCLGTRPLSAPQVSIVQDRFQWNTERQKVRSGIYLKQF